MRLTRRLLSQPLVYGVGLHLPQPYYQHRLQQQLTQHNYLQDSLEPMRSDDTGLYTARHYHPTNHTFQATLAPHPLRVDNGVRGPLLFDGWLLIQPALPPYGPLLEGPYDIRLAYRYPQWAKGLRLIKPSEWLTTWQGCYRTQADKFCLRLGLDPTEKVEGIPLRQRYGFYICQPWNYNRNVCNHIYCPQVASEKYVL